MNCSKIWNYLQQVVNQQVKQASASGAIVCISGGIDSTVVAALAVEALGADNVRGLLLPYYHNTHFNDAHEVAYQFLKPEHIEIIWLGKIVDAAHDLGIASTDLTTGNLLARLRMIVAYDRARIHNYLVIGTCNKSEIMTGYLTKYGDGASDFDPLGDILKTDLYELADWYNKTHVPIIPNYILTKAPSADLIEGQKDEDDLGPYEQLDNILRYYLGECGTIRESKEAINKIVELIKNSEHKRKMPPVPQIPEEWLILDGEKDMSLSEFRITISNYIDTLDGNQSVKALFKAFVRALLPLTRK
jgi:NAD+ synthase